MCQECQVLAEKYLGPWMPKDDMCDYLFSNTCFPFGGPEHIEPQLRILSNLAQDFGIQGAGWILHKMWDEDYDRERQGDPPFWFPLSLEWCDGLEQPACEK